MFVHIPAILVAILASRQSTALYRSSKQGAQSSWAPTKWFSAINKGQRARKIVKASIFLEFCYGFAQFCSFGHILQF